MVYRKEPAFINRQNELAHLRGYIADRPESILFLHGPKSSGKTTLLYHFLTRLSEKDKIDIKFLNLRKVLIVSYKDFLKLFFGLDYNQAKGDVKEIREYDVKIKITDYALTKEQAQKIWDIVGGSMWEIQSILSDLFHSPLDEALNDYKMQMKGMIDDYIGFSSVKKELLSLLVKKSLLRRSEIINEIHFATEIAEKILQDLVANNILYYDPTKAIFYPQGKSIELGIRSYFEENRI